MNPRDDGERGELCNKIVFTNAVACVRDVLMSSERSEFIYSGGDEEVIANLDRHCPSAWRVEHQTDYSGPGDVRKKHR